MKEKITARTKAIAPVHPFGNEADMDALSDLSKDHDIKIISDSAQAHGTEYAGRDLGSYDDLNCYSFYPSKTLTTGEGEWLQPTIKNSTESVASLGAMEMTVDITT